MGDANLVIRQLLWSNYLFNDCPLLLKYFNNHKIKNYIRFLYAIL